MDDSHSDTDRAPLGHLIATAIVVLAGVNGVFTYSGAKLLVDVWYYALLFAVVVQFAIATSLIALPAVRGAGRAVLLLVYLAALSLSSASAYSFVYTAGSEGGVVQARGLSAATRAQVGAVMGEALQRGRGALEARQQQVERLRRAVEEEASVGLRSGRGPGKGPEYYGKLDALSEAQQLLELDRARLAALERQFETLAEELTAGAQAGQRGRLVPLVARAQSLTAVPQAGAALRGLLQGSLAIPPSPVETALASVLDRDGWSIALVVSLVWAAIFDLLALFLGIVRYDLLRPGRSVLHGLHGWVAAWWMFFLRLGRVRCHAELQRRRGLEEAGRNTPLNSLDMQNFATYLLASGQPGADAEANAPAAIRRLIAAIEPLHVPAAPDSVGIPHRSLEPDPALKNLVAFLIRHQVLDNDVDNRCYVLNAGGELANKVLVLIRVGLSPESLDGARRLAQGASAAQG